MRFAPAVLAFFAAFPCAALSPDTAPSDKMRKEIARLEARAEASPVARRLFAATRHVPRREVRDSGLPDAIDVRGGEKPEFVFDAARLPRTSETDAELMLVLNSARAFLAFSIPIVEAEQAAWQRTLQFALERGAQDPAGFGALLAKAVRAADARSGVLRLPDGALARAGLLLRLLERNPLDFYWAIEAGAAWPQGYVRLAELEDLYALRAKEIAALKAPPEGPYAMLGGRRYRGPLVRAAFLLRGTGEVERLRESLESYDGVGLASVRVAADHWRRAVGR